jgi:hypothetical protein
MSDVVSKQKIQKKSFSILGPFSELNWRNNTVSVFWGN